MELGVEEKLAFMKGLSSLLEKHNTSIFFVDDKDENYLGPRFCAELGITDGLFDLSNLGESLDWSDIDEEIKKIEKTQKERMIVDRTLKTLEQRRYESLGDILHKEMMNTYSRKEAGKMKLLLGDEDNGD